MPSPFPGMDPYLEYAPGWSNFHHWFLMGIAERLAPLLRPHYFVSVEERVYLSSAGDMEPAPYSGSIVPDVSVTHGPSSAAGSVGGVSRLTRPMEVRLPQTDLVRETYLEIRDVRTERKMVSTLEVLSPTNKKPGAGQRKYLRKRDAVLSSAVNLIEIDLLRAGERTPVMGAPPSFDYSVMVSRAASRPYASFYPFSVRDSLPCVAVPLRSNEAEQALDLGQVLAVVYDRGSFDLAIDYQLDPEPLLALEDASWADGLLREKGLR